MFYDSNYNNKRCYEETYKCIDTLFCEWTSNHDINKLDNYKYLAYLGIVFWKDISFDSRNYEWSAIMTDLYIIYEFEENEETDVVFFNRTVAILFNRIKSYKLKGVSYE